MPKNIKKAKQPSFTTATTGLMFDEGEINLEPLEWHVAPRSNVLLKDSARNRLIRGVDAVADAVKLTLGAAGSNAILESDLSPGHMVTNDGVSIARSIKLEDPFENMGADLIREVANRADAQGGDGTTTTTVLTQAILHAGADTDANPMDIKRSLDECLPIIEKAIDDQTRLITVDEVGQVATISAEDPKLGALFQEIYQKIGKDGIIELDNAKSPATVYEVGEGVRFRNTVLYGPHQQSEPGKAIYRKPVIMVTKQKITSIEELHPIVGKVQKTGAHEMVLFFDEIDMTAASQLAYAVVQGGFKVYLIKAPTLWKDWIMEDIARVTGATLIDPAAGLQLMNVEVGHLGTCDKLVGSRDEVRLIGIKDISEAVAKLQEGSDEDKLRASWLNTKAATLYLGANSDSELSYVRLKAEDARNASYLALKDGVVPGGGVTLFNAAKELPKTVGGEILAAALCKPIWQIMENAGVNSMENEMEIGGSKGFDAKTCKTVDMWEAGIIDPASVVKSAIRNAISVAGIVLTTNVAVILPPKETKNEAPHGMPVM